MTRNHKQLNQNGALGLAAKQLADHIHKIQHVEAILLRARIDRPVYTSFGTMYDRPALLVRITDADGCAGYGEIWCNFPTGGAEYKASLLVNECAHWLNGRCFSTPAEIFDGLTDAFVILGLQTADPGSLLQIIAGIDQALWDMVARKKSIRLCELFGVKGDAVKVYASGISPHQSADLARFALARGFTAFKVKVGFGEEADQAGVRAAREVIGDHHLMIDANQAWKTPQQASDNINALHQYNLRWAEEPLPASTSPAVWQAMDKMINVPLAGGENLASLDDIDICRATNLFSVLQPDIGKIGGFTGLLRIFDRSAASHEESRCLYCPHWLGGMMGLAASAHLLTVVGGAGLLEVDVNENPIREHLADWDLRPSVDGRLKLPDGFGVGINPDFDVMKECGVDVMVL